MATIQSSVQVICTSSAAHKTPSSHTCLLHTLVCLHLSCPVLLLSCQCSHTTPKLNWEMETARNMLHVKIHISGKPNFLDSGPPPQYTHTHTHTHTHTTHTHTPHTCTHIHKHAYTQHLYKYQIKLPSQTTKDSMKTIVKYGCCCS